MTKPYLVKIKRETVNVLVESIEIPIEADDDEEASYAARRLIEKGALNWKAWKIVSNKQAGGAVSVEDTSELDEMPRSSPAFANPLQRTLF